MASTPAPCISVLMAAYNGQQFLHEAVVSILNQTFTDFEFIIIDDGSKDSTWNILKTYQMQDSRIVLHQSETNVGLTRSLNKGLELARGEFIARQDADDISMPERLATQLAYMQEHPTVGLLGTAFNIIDEDGHPKKAFRPPTSDGELRWRMLFHNPFAHTSVMLRKNLLTKHNLCYDPAFRYAQDYELWSRCLKYTSIAILDDPLVEHRVHSMTITVRKALEQEEACNLIIQHHLKYLVPQFDVALSSIIKLRQLYHEFPRYLSKEEVQLCHIILYVLRYLGLNKSNSDRLPEIQRTWIKRISQAVSWKKNGLIAVGQLALDMFALDPHFTSSFLLRRIFRR